MAWLLRWPVWAILIPGGTAMVFNTALCLTLGLSLAMLGQPARRWLVNGMALLILAIAIIQLAENLFSVQHGFDWASLHVWYTDKNPHPGRLAPNTALALMLCAISLVALASPHASAPPSRPCRPRRSPSA